MTSSAHPVVPRFNQLHRGTPVNIVLKADQRTGKLTTGHIADILTKGDHPRGIKVRLGDGSIGRVQSLGKISEQQRELLDMQAAVGGELAYARGAGAGAGAGVEMRGAAYGNGSESGRRRSGSESQGGVMRGGSGGGWKMQDDVRNDPVPVDERSLDEYIKAPSRNKGKKGRKAGGLGGGGSSATNTEEAAPGVGTDGSGSGVKRKGVETREREAGLMEGSGGGQMIQEQLEKEFPRLDSALIAAIVADNEGVAKSREVLSGLT